MADIDAVILNYSRINSKTFSGLSSVDVLATFENEIMKGNSINVLVFGCELFFAGVSMRSNIWNKLIIISLESIGLAEPNAIIWTYYLFKNHTAQSFATCCSILSNMKKTRYNYWASQLYPQFGDSIIGSLLASKVGTPEECSNFLLQSLQDKDIGKCLYYTKTLIYHQCRMKTKRNAYRSNNCHVGIWDAFDTIFKEENNYQKYYQICREIGLMRYFKWSSRSYIIFVHLIHMWCNNVVVTPHMDKMNKTDSKFIQKDSLFPSKISPFNSVNDHESILRQIISGKLGIPEIPTNESNQSLEENIANEDITYKMASQEYIRLLSDIS
jgi:hypothetical protein